MILRQRRQRLSITSLVVLLECIAAWFVYAFLPKPLRDRRAPAGAQWLQLRHQLQSSRSTPSRSLMVLFAKKAGKTAKRKAAGASGGGGFGSGGTKAKPSKKRKRGGGSVAVASPRASTAGDDYSVFPVLEPQVLETLVPSPHEWKQGSSEAEEADGQSQGLPNEVYQRLDQIYGLPNFNFDDDTLVGDGATDDDPMSFSDMISAGSSATPSSSLDELFRSPTADMSSSSSTTLSTTGSLEIDNLLASATGASPSPQASLSPPPPAEQEGLLSTLQGLSQFEKFRVLHVDPLVIAIDDFFTPEECDRYVAMSSGTGDQGKDAGSDDSSGSVMESRSPTVGRDSVSRAQRTSTTYYHHYKNVPELMSKASRLLGLDTLRRWEEPQTVRYRRNEKFTWHLDALGPTENQPDKGGQRVATLLVYLTGLNQGDGGATIFRDLRDGSSSNTGDDSKYLRVQPNKGSALLFFPSAGGIPDQPLDIRTLHCGEAVASDSSQDKWIAQLWLRVNPYTPTAPPGNKHAAAAEAVADYCCG